MHGLRLPLTIISFLALFSVSAQKYCEPSYSGNGNPNSNGPTPFFTHILRMNFANIDRQVVAPGSVFQDDIYNDFTDTDTLRLTQTAKYPLKIELGNGANTQTFAVWIDYNQNKVFESTERIASRTDVANVGDHKHSFGISIPKSAVLGYTRMRIGTLYGSSRPDPCNNSRPDDFNAGIIDWSQDFQDYTVEIVKPNIQLFEDVSVSHTNFDEVEAGSVSNELLRIDVKTNEDGTISPLTADSFYFNLLGSTNPSDIKKARLYYTGKNSAFNTNNLVDTLSNPTLDFTLSSDRKLRPGTNYFWLAVDLSEDALLENRVDARCNGVYVVTNRVPNNINPNGDRPVGYCNSKGNRSMFVYVRRVQLNTLNLFSTWNNTGYSDYTNRSTDLERGDSATLTIDVGNGVNNSFTKAWIDFNADGDFDDQNELILFDSITNASQNNFTYGPVEVRFKIPNNAKVGPTRLRISSASKADQFPWKAAQNACDDVVEIGEVEDYTVNIFEDGEPVSDFSVNVACLGDTSRFVDRSTTFNTTFYRITSWSWDFGDGNTSTAENPTHVYNNAGKYKVMLITNTNKPGTPDTTYQIISVEDPEVDFSLSTSLSGVPIRFTDQTRNASVVFWTWDFDNPNATVFPNSSNFANPDHQFDAKGNYDVKLIVQTAGGCIDSTIKTVNIVDALKPIANFNANSFEPYKTADLALVDLSANRPTKWSWSINPSSHSYAGNTTDSSQNPIVNLNDIARYKVTLTASNSAGSDTLTRFFSTKDYTKPEADFSANQTDVKAGQIVSFTDLSTNDPTTYEWIFGDGDTTNISNPVHQYNVVGDYTVKLNVSNPAGKDSEDKIDYITVSDEYTMCQSDVTVSPLYKGTLYDSGGDAGQYDNNENCEFLIRPDCAGPITLAFSEFDMANGDFIKIFDYDEANEILVPLHTGSGFSGNTKPANLKANLGAVIVQVESDRNTVSDGFKLVWSAAPNIKPKAKIIADSVGYANSAMIIENATTVGTGNQYLWDLDNDGFFEDSSDTKVSVLFTQGGKDTIVFVAKNCSGSDTLVHVVNVDTATTAPTAKFTANDTVIYAYDEVQFTDLSTQGPNEWEWNVETDNFNYTFVNGTSASSRNPVVLFFEPGYYTVSLIASNDLGSSKKLVKKKYILVQTNRSLCLFPFNDSSPAGRLSDDGGEDNPYGSDECDFLLDPCAKEVILDIKSFDYRPGDYLRVYDGKDNTGTPLHPAGTNGFTNGDDPTAQPLVAESGSMYIEHDANAFNRTYEGFVANWSTVAYDDPDLDFEAPDTAYIGGNIVFFNEQVDEKGNDEIKYLWDFENDGITDDTIPNPLHEFKNLGKRFVELKVESCDSKDSILKTIQVIRPKGPPAAKFSVSRKRAATTDIVTFQDRSTNGPGKWRWHFIPDNITVVEGTDSFPKVSVTFNRPDTYSVALYVENNLGSDSIYRKDEIIVYEYCEPTIDNPTPQIGINFFSLGDIENSTTSGQSPYTDYSSTHSTRLTAGGKHAITVSRQEDNPGMNVKVWVDLNRDGTFSSTEEQLSWASAGAQIFKDTLSIPAGTDFGITRLRVGTSLGTDDNTPCGPNNFGEFEDYEVLIGPDDIKPVLTLLGNRTEFSEVGYPYTDSGATAWDNVDGDITDSIRTISTVDTTKAGTYTITYSVSDSAGNQADELTRTVVITSDVTKPTLTLLGDNPFILDVFDEFVDPGATAFDNLDGDITSNVVVNDAALDSSRVGEYDVIYSAYDNANNAADALVRVVEVVDREAPVITLRGQSNVVLDEGDPYVEDSADVTDNYYQDVDLIISGNVNTNAPGEYYRYYDATDRSGNSATQVVRTIVVEEQIGIAEIEGLKQVELFPNPATNEAYLRYETSKSIRTSVRLIDATGKELYYADEVLLGKGNLKLNVANIPSGIYYVEIQSNGSMHVEKLTITR